MTRFIVAATLGGALAAIALSASAAQFTKNSGGSGGGVTRAEFDRLQGQVQTLEGRVAALERMSGRSGGQGGAQGGGKGGKSGGRGAGGRHGHNDSWTGG